MLKDKEVTSRLKNKVDRLWDTKGPRTAVQALYTDIGPEKLSNVINDSEDYLERRMLISDLADDIAIDESNIEAMTGLTHDSIVQEAVPLEEKADINDPVAWILGRHRDRAYRQEEVMDTFASLDAALDERQDVQHDNALIYDTDGAGVTNAVHIEKADLSNIIDLVSEED